MRRLLCSILLLASTPGSAQDWLVVGAEQFAPYSFLSAFNQQPQGLDVELINAVMAEAHINYELRLYPWGRVKRLLERQEVTMAFQFAGTPVRLQQYELVGPLRSGSTVFMVNDKLALNDWHSLADLEPYTIGQVRGYSYAADFDRAPLQRDSIAQTPRQLVTMLLAGRIDIIVGDETQLKYFAQEQNATERVRVLPTPLVKMPRYVAFSKGDNLRAKQFAEALERLRQAGTLQEISQRWQ
ncbi:substrate-binding periplasmic protein [Pseudomonas sp. 5P_3.1_Bac2]|uniref:substrate-binding periplasmic protein n=1 Tax=Pseudomonas sp. 5P_3.1_Bac2 TaxID=2971617 RepID=UPI0021C5DAEE|nr:transporter substrate-binding domain-containing protein [Pseudomonas sp. 5P_3.1_Bac2]MCU1719414.1 transporter substrate-binding domain-containing protein [Pseudomonas sp. 5P_3.1_Bac2]